MSPIKEVSDIRAAAQIGQDTTSQNGNLGVFPSWSMNILPLNLPLNLPARAKKPAGAHLINSQVRPFLAPRT